MTETRTSIKCVRDFRIKPTETFNLLQTAGDIWCRSVSHKEIAVKNNK